jgi:hypothetical protein
MDRPPYPFGMATAIPFLLIALTMQDSSRRIGHIRVTKNLVECKYEKILFRSDV